MEKELDIRTIEPQRKHPTIFETFEALNPEEAFILVNDHNPQPLRYQMNALIGEEKFLWEYLEEGPVWKIRIGKTTT